MVKTIVRSLMLGLVAVLVLTMAATPVHAQTDNCYGLSADDCALLKSATGGKLTSFNMDYQLTLVASGMRGQDIDLSVKGSGPFEFDAAGANLQNFDPTAAGAALDKLTMENTIAVSNTKNGKTETANGDIRVLNGTVYFESDKATGGQWKSIALKDLAARRLGRVGNRPGGGGNPVNPATAIQMIGQLEKLAAIPGFIRIERTADTTVENQQIATFVYHFDLPTLFNSPDFATFIQSATAMNPGRSRLNADQVKAMLPMIANALKDSTVTLTRMVGVTDKLPHGFGVDFILKLDPAIMRGMMRGMIGGGLAGGSDGGAATPDASPQPVNVNFHFLLNITGIGSKANVIAPEGATPINVGGGSAGGESTAEPTMAATMAATSAQ